MRSRAHPRPRAPARFWHSSLPKWKRAVRVVEGKNLGFLRVWKHWKHFRYSSLTCACAGVHMRACTFNIVNASNASKTRPKCYQIYENVWFFSGRVEGAILTVCFQLWKGSSGQRIGTHPPYLATAGYGGFDQTRRNKLYFGLAAAIRAGRDLWPPPHCSPRTAGFVAGYGGLRVNPP